MTDSGRPAAGELELINGYTRKPLKEDEVYVFPVVLCDNEIDRDYERFSDASLEKLSGLYVGVTGITDHEAKAGNQSARIFSCRVEEVAGRSCSDGRPYRRLVARAYIPRSEKSASLIAELDGGIRKEVSVGCAVKKRICSVCGADISECGHIRGRKYDGSVCYALLDEPADAYEWSFVAVPAQKNAGVVKNFGMKKKDDKKGVVQTDIEKKLFSGEEQSFTADEMKELVRRFRSLEKKAVDGEYYRDRLIREVKSLSAVVLPELCEDTVCRIADGLSVRQLDELIKAFEGRAEEIMPVKPQLYRENKGTVAGNEGYRNI